MKKEFSSNWKSSKQPRKQRKYRYNAPLHIKRKFMGIHLSKDLKKKYSKRNLIAKKGDTVKVVRGQFKGKIGKIEKVDIKKERIYMVGLEITKKDGTKTKYPINPSNLILTDLTLEDKKRMVSLKRK